MGTCAQEIIEVYENIIELQIEKRVVLSSRDLDKLGGLDEKIVSLYNRALAIAKEKESLEATAEEKRHIRTLYEQMHKLEKINQTIIERSLHLINQIFTGVMKIVNVQPNEYTNKGKTQINQDYGLSTIYEEA